MRVTVTLSCSQCKRRNYTTTKNKRTTPDKLALNKYCRFCREHCLHKETK
ncbi:MAG: 50S ribosomal protein L33 [Desulfosudaceae bacterium]